MSILFVCSFNTGHITGFCFVNTGLLTILQKNLAHSYISSIERLFHQKNSIINSYNPNNNGIHHFQEFATNTSSSLTFSFMYISSSTKQLIDQEQGPICLWPGINLPSPESSEGSKGQSIYLRGRECRGQTSWCF